MSRRRPSNRDRLEREFLALARERDAVLRDYEQRMTALQGAIERVEAPRLAEGCEESGPRRDELDARPALSVLGEESPAEEGDEGGEVAEVRAEGEDRVVALRAMGLLLGVCAMVLREQEHPKLVVHCVRLAADLPGAISMREVASIYGLSPARISQRVEEIQRRFNLKKNRHNKSAEAVRAYRETAALINQPESA